MIMKTINLAIVGYGNLGRALEKEILSRPEEFTLEGIYTRENFDTIKSKAKQIDVAMFCGGSANDALESVSALARAGISTVDSFDNHEKIKDGTYKNALLKPTKKGKSVSICGAGWDPGFLSLQRLLGLAIFPKGVFNTFYGGQNGGVSLGHSNAIRDIDGVKNAIQLTVTRDDAVESAQNGQAVAKNDCHKRVCYVVAESENHGEIENQIRNMPNYFLGQQVEVNFIEEDEFNEKFENYKSHSGQYLATDGTDKISVQIKTESNPALTAKIMLTYARANARLKREKKFGVYDVGDVSIKYILGKQNSTLDLI